jgi:hypothetical protein
MLKSGIRGALEVEKLTWTTCGEVVEIGKFDEGDDGRCCTL